MSRYWLRKMIWLSETDTTGHAANIFADLVNKTDHAAHATVPQDRPDVVSITKGSYHENFHLSHNALFIRPEPVSSQSVKSSTMSFIRRLTSSLSNGSMVYLSDYGISRWGISKKSAPAVAGILLSGGSVDDKMRKLVDAHFASSLEDSLVRGFVEHLKLESDVLERLMDYASPSTGANSEETPARPRVIPDQPAVSAPVNDEAAPSAAQASAALRADAGPLRAAPPRSPAWTWIFGIGGFGLLGVIVLVFTIKRFLR